ncbi:MAG: biotin transporter BioY [Armatimonadota bacterium]
MNLKKMIYSVFFSALTAAGAYIAFPTPFSPVPVTLQSLFVLLAGALLGSSYGALSQIVYILLGVSGIPVFAGGAAGPFALAGPTGGYLLGFIIAAFTVGKLSEIIKKNNFYIYTGTFTLGTFIIYIIGAGYLKFFMHINFKSAVFLGILPFVPGGILKIIGGSFLAVKLKRILETVMN